MFFDKVAGFVERIIPMMVTDLEQTALFEFPFCAHEAVAPGRFCQEDLGRFFLQFSRTATPYATAQPWLIPSLK